MLKYENILKEDNLDLRTKASEVTLPLNDEDMQTILALYEYLQNGYDTIKAQELNIRPGVGIAAPQIGIHKKMFVIVAFDEQGNYYEWGVINPRILSHSEQLTYLEGGEGCLSIDREVQGIVHRYRRIKVQFMALDFKTKETTNVTLNLKGYLAVVFQHEYDHLFGRLFVDRINKKNPFFIPANSVPVVFENEESEDNKTGS